MGFDRWASDTGVGLGSADDMYSRLDARLTSNISVTGSGDQLIAAIIMICAEKTGNEVDSVRSEIRDDWVAVMVLQAFPSGLNGTTCNGRK